LLSCFPALQPTTKGAGRELTIPSGAFAVCCIVVMVAQSGPAVKGQIVQLGIFRQFWLFTAKKAGCLLCIFYSHLFFVCGQQIERPG
jgi:hypothetical protein